MSFACILFCRPHDSVCGEMLPASFLVFLFFFFQAEDGIRDVAVTGVQTCALPISECGRAFDPGNPRTYRRRPPSIRLKWARRITLALLVITLPPGAGLSWLW